MLGVLGSSNGAAATEEEIGVEVVAKILGLVDIVHMIAGTRVVGKTVVVVVVGRSFVAWKEARIGFGVGH